MVTPLFVFVVGIAVPDASLIIKLEMISACRPPGTFVVRFTKRSTTEPSEIGL